jgi:hypothetical protein
MPVPAMHHVVVEWQHHQCRVCDDAPELARIEGAEFHRLTFAHRTKGSHDLIGGEYW